MTEREVREIADKFLLRSIDRPLRFIGVTKSKRSPQEWNVVYETTDLKGIVFDGPTLVIVDENRREARFFE